MAKVRLSVKQVLGFAILGLDNGNTEAARHLLQECHDQLPDDDSNEDGIACLISVSPMEN